MAIIDVVCAIAEALMAFHHFQTGNITMGSVAILFCLILLIFAGMDWADSQ